MANEPNNKTQGQQQSGGQQNEPPKKPQATPAQIAGLIVKVSETLQDFYPAEQVRVLRAVSIANNLDLMGTAKK